MAALIALLLAGLSLAWRYGPEPVAQHLFRQSALASAEPYALHLAASLEAGPGSFESGVMTARDRSALLAVTGTQEVFRLILRDATGNPLWSNRPRQGLAPLSPAILAEVLRTGKAFFEHIHATEAEVIGTAQSGPETQASVDHEGRDVNHVVVPVLDKGRIVGLIERFQDVTAINNAWLATIRWTLASVGGLIGALGLAAALRVRRASAERFALARAHSEAETSFLAEQLRMGREVKLLGELNEWLQSSKSLDELFYMVTRFMTHLLPDVAGSIYVYSNSRDVLDGASSWNGGAHKAHIHPEDCWGLRRGRTYAFAEGEVKFRCGHAHEEETAHYICIPFLAHGETVGMMHLYAHAGSDPEAFNAGKKLAQMCAEQISLAIANVRMRDELHHQAIRDVLTGLYNRRHMMDTLRRRIETRKAAPFAIISIDVDYFKKFNDNHGHDAGDVVLRAVGEVLTASCNGSEIACRMGGEELMLMLPDLTLDQALDRADAVRQAVQALTVRYGDKSLPQITISTGVALYPEHGATPQDVIRLADEALYAAKAAGRNCVVAAGAFPPGMLMPLGRVEDLDPEGAAIAAE